MRASDETDLLIIGAGPFGLSLSARAVDLGIDHVIVGEPMGFWKHHMPAGMYLRSASDWHYDASNADTIEAFLAAQGKRPADVEPLSLAFYLGYPQWFMARRNIQPVRKLVTALHSASGRGYRAVFEDGSAMTAKNVVLAVGFANFPAMPPELTAVLPPGRYAHTCERVQLDACAGKRVLIIGGRQSAFEWAALLAEAGAREVYVSCRHDAPSFEASDWSWVEPLMRETMDHPAWYRSLTAGERQRLSHRLWGEGRLKLEPWLAPRLAVDAVTIRPNTRLAACDTRPSGELAIALDNGEIIEVDEVILATGYAVDIRRVPFLANGDLLPGIAVQDGYPVLDTSFQTTLPGLFMTSMAAARDFGPFFGFTVAVRASSTIIGDAVRARLKAQR